jgi:hypothetical protein
MSDAPRRLPPKKEVALALLEGPSVFVHLDPRREGVIVPKWLMGQPQLVLQVGLNMAIPIPDLKVDDDGVTCTLSFNRAPFWCSLPWNAIYALVGEDGRGMIWPNDVPPEVSLQMQKAAAPATKPPTKKPRAKLSSVADADSDRRRRRDGDGLGDGDGRKPDGDGRRPEAGPTRGRRAVPVPVPVPAEARADGDGSADGARATPAAATPNGRKPRRELPPYLRVIK